MINLGGKSLAIPAVGALLPLQVIPERLTSYIPLKVELSKSDIACQLILSEDSLTCHGCEVMKSSDNNWK